MLYIRMFMIMGVTLYTSRVILEALGVSNYGIYSVVAGVIGLLGFINSSMSISVQRFLSYHLGRQDNEKFNATLSTSILIHLAIGIIIPALLWFTGEWIITKYLVIPAANIESAVVLFKYIVVATVFGIFQVPFIGLIISHERMGILTLTSVIEVLLKLLIAFALFWISRDRLELFGLLLMITSIVTCTAYIFNSLFFIQGIKIKFKWNSSSFRELIGFSSWSVLGEISWAFTIQGVSIILNFFYGVVGNAAYGIAIQVSSAVNRFVSSFQMAINPQIIKSYAANQINSMIELLLQGIKYSYYLLFIVAVPAIISMKQLLSLWLTDVPEYTVGLCIVIVISTLLDSLSTLFATAAKAYGDIRNYQLIVSFVLFLNFPLSYFVLKMGCQPSSVIWIYCLVSFILLIVRLCIVQKMLRVNLMFRYIKEVLFPILLVTIINATIAFVISGFMPHNYLRIIYSTTIMTVLNIGTIYLLGLNERERKAISNLVYNKVIKKILKH